MPGIDLREVSILGKEFKNFQTSSYLLDDQLADQVIFRLGSSLINQVTNIVKQVSVFDSINTFR